MGLNAKAAIRDGLIAITFEKRVNELLFTHEQAFQWGDQLGQLAAKACTAGGSGLSSPLNIQMSVQLRGVLVVLSFKTAQIQIELWPNDAYFLSDELILVAQKAEKVLRQIRPTVNDVDHMEAALAGVGRHALHQHPTGTIWKPTSNGQMNGQGLSLVRRLPLLSRLIRKPWY